MPPTRERGSGGSLSGSARTAGTWGGSYYEESGAGVSTLLRRMQGRLAGASEYRPDSPHATNRAQRLLIGAASAVVLVAIGAWFVPSTVRPDSDFYQALARGDIDEVNRPFAQRVLHPLGARLLHELGLPYTAAFVVFAVLALFVFTIAVAVLLPKELPTWGVFALLVTPLAASMFVDAYLPDLTFAALTAVLLLLLRSFGARAWTALALLPLFLVRESTLLLTIVWMAVAWRQKLRRVACAVAATGAAAYLLAGRIGAEGAPSLHNVSGPLYLAGKVPFNAMKNVLGFPVWTNDVDAAYESCSTPWWDSPLPAGVHLGNIDTVGLCPFDATGPLTALTTWLTLFGVAPTVLWVLWRRQRAKARPVWVQVALWVGLISFVIGPALGAAQVRLIGYGWPAMLIAMPWLLAQARLSLRSVFEILILVASLSWIAAVILALLPGVAGLLLAILLAVPHHALALRRLRAPSSVRPEPGPV